MECEWNANDTDRKLEHNNHDRNRDSHHATESCGRAEEGIRSWRYAWQVGIAHSEPSALGVLPMAALSGVHIKDAHDQPINCLDDDSNKSAEGCTYRHGRNEYSRGDLASV